MSTLQARSILGQRGASMGFWVSPPGVDVVSGADEDLLISTSNSIKNLSYISKGRIHLPPSARRFIVFSGFGGKLFKPSPIVWAQPYDALRKNLLVPSLQPNSPFESFTGYPPRYNMEPQSDAGEDILYINNMRNFAYYLQYIIFAISGVDN